MDITLPSKSIKIPSASEVEVHAQLNVINHENMENEIVDDEGRTLSFWELFHRTSGCQWFQLLHA